ncbi:transposase [Microbulbifer sp. 2205BS26-8]|uniref:transposase n=1 Tax=Microbulbifer sp. 2205BS26-8 TaxID=3064386 RepID=UPI00273E9B3C|nr:transposase [Microbulbifer sp. 2205BS26-8]MDP5210790.1 transposase [Microbulbifer sp. 2205BS26-8]
MRKLHIDPNWSFGKETQLTEKQWEAIRSLLPGKAEDPGRTGADNRNFVNAVLWVLSTGSLWKQLPERFGQYKSVHKRYKRWEEKGIWDRVFAQLKRDLETGLPVFGDAGCHFGLSGRRPDSAFDVGKVD